MKHGLVTFGATAQESYERMIRLVSLAEEFLARRGAWTIDVPDARGAGASVRVELAELRAAISATAGAPMIVTRHADPKSLGFARRPDVDVLSQSGPLTPDHVLHTKRLPLIGRDVAAYAAAYSSYFEGNLGGRSLTMLDPAPRIVLDPDLGMCTAGSSFEAAEIAADIYKHTIDVILRATALGGYQALPPEDVFDVEYWGLEQAKLLMRRAPAPFAGEIALVTGAASGIGKACAALLLERGAAVVGIDVDPRVAKASDHLSYLGVVCDVTAPAELDRALEQGVERFGGLDLLVLNAGVFPPSRPIAGLEPDEWRRVMSVNLDAAAVLLRDAHPLLKLSPRGGRVVIVASKNVPAPGPGAAAYSASKAALTQLARVAALEWGADGIRVNVVHPHGVFDTALWSDDVIRERAGSYGLTEDEYRTNNLLRTEVRSSDVAELVAALCGPAFSKTTGAQVPIDGGNERVV